MKFNNLKRINNTKQFYTTLFIIFLAVFVFINITPILNSRFNMVKYIFLGLAFIIVLLAFLGNGYFEYDSTGMVVILKNDSITKKSMAPLAVKTLEFPKKKLKDFKIRNYIVYRSLIIYLNSKEKGTVKKHFNITNISPKRTKYLKQSLKKILRENNA